MADVDGTRKFCCFYQRADPSAPANAQWHSCNCQPCDGTWCTTVKQGPNSYRANLDANMCDTWDGTTLPGFDNNAASSSRPNVGPTPPPPPPRAPSTPPSPPQAQTTPPPPPPQAQTTPPPPPPQTPPTPVIAPTNPQPSDSNPLPGKAVVAYVNDAFGYESHPPAGPTPFNILVVSFLYTTSQDSGAKGNKDAFTFTLDAYENSGRFTSASSPLPTWIRAWQAASPSRKVFISIGGAAYGYGGFEVYPLWAKDPQRVVNALSAFLTAFAPIVNFDGVDFDYEDTPSLMGTGCSPTWGFGVQLLIDLTNMLKAARPSILISHAPQPPYLIPNCGSKNINNMGGYVPVLAAVGSKVDYLLIQFYNNPGWMECQSSADASAYKISEILDSLVRQGMPKARLIVGKPLMPTGDADSGYVAPADLPTCVGRDHASYGGIMFWALSGPNSPARWTAMQQFINAYFGSGASLAEITASSVVACSNVLSPGTIVAIVLLVVFMVLFAVLFGIALKKPEVFVKGVPAGA